MAQFIWILCVVSYINNKNINVESMSMAKKALSFDTNRVDDSRAFTFPDETKIIGCWILLFKLNHAIWKMPAMVAIEKTR